MENKINLELIKKYLLENKLSKKEFCKECNISISVFNKILKNEQNFRITALCKIAKKLQIGVCDIFLNKTY